MTLDKIYRRCPCGETAHDPRYDIALDAIVWACRNCAALAKNRYGDVRVYRAPHPSAID